MSWVTVIWSMTAAACVTMAAMHLLVWIRDRDSWASLLFSTSALAVAAIAGFELAMMRAESPGQFGARLQWMHLPVWVLVLALVGFVRHFLQAGKPWLAWGVCGTRTLALILNFVLTPNLNFREITGLQRIPWWGGELVSVPVGVASSWTLIGQLSSVLLLAFLLDASITAWRRGGRRRALLLGGSMMAGVLVAAGQSALTVWAGLQVPYILSLAFLGMLSVMGYELSRDLLRARQLARELQASEARMSLAAEAATLGLWEWDIVRDEVWVTNQGRACLGLPGTGRMDFAAFVSSVYPDDLEAVTHAVTASKNGGGDFETEHRAVLPDGQVRWIAAHGRVEFDHQRKAVAMRGVSLDVSRRRQAEEEAMQRRNELAHLSRMSLLGELSGSLAHELNQPLGAILANAEAAEVHLQGNPPNLDEVRAILADICKDDLRAGDIIHRMRAFLRRGELELQPLTLGQLVEETLKLLSADAAARKAVVEVRHGPDCPGIRGDRVQLQQVLLNLFLNSLDAMSECPAGNRRLMINTGCTDAGQAELSVTDSGPGIPAGKLAGVFEPFYTTKPGGLGLGLPICRSIIEAHGGRIWMESELGRGTTARFTLPARAGDGSREPGTGTGSKESRRVLHPD